MDAGKWAVAGLAAFLANIPELVWFLCILMLLDVAFSVGVWAKQRRMPTYDEVWSVTGKKAYHLFVVLLGGLFDRYVGIPHLNFLIAFTTFFIPPEIYKILTKAVILEVPIPPQFARVLELFAPEEGKHAPHDSQEAKRYQS